MKSTTADQGADGLHKMDVSQIGFHCISNRLYVPPGIAITKHQQDGASSATEKLVNEFSDFCTNSVGLLWKELFTSNEEEADSYHQNVAVPPEEDSPRADVSFPNSVTPI